MKYKVYELESQILSNGANVHRICNYLHQIRLILRILSDISQESCPDQEDIEYAERSKQHVFAAVQRIFELTGIKLPQTLEYDGYTLEIPQPEFPKD